MNEKNIKSFPIARKRKKEFIFGGGWLILISLGLASCSILDPNSVQDNAGGLIIYALIIAFGISMVWYPFQIHISLSENGLTYHTPFFSLSCAWKDIDGYKIYPRRGIYIHSKQKVQVSRSKRLARIFATRDKYEIPLFLFHDPPDKEGRIKANELLSDIKKYQAEYTHQGQTEALKYS